VQGRSELPSAEKNQDPGDYRAQRFEAGLELVLWMEGFKIKKPGHAVPPRRPDCGGRSVVLS